MPDDPVSIDPAVLRDAIEFSRAEIRARQAIIGQMRGILEGPRVRVLACYFRHFHEHEDECDSIDDARGLLQYQVDTGTGSPIGVRVNGEMIPWDDVDDS